MEFLEPISNIESIINTRNANDATCYAIGKILLKYEFARLPAGAALLKSTMVYKIKQTKDGAIDKYKARLCVRGDMQKYGINFVETFALAIAPSFVCFEPSRAAAAAALIKKKRSA